MKKKLDTNKFEEYDYEWSDLKNDKSTDCIFCDNDISKSRTLRICDECTRDLFIMHTVALKQYKLKKSDVSDLESNTWKNGYGGYSTSYLLRDIRIKAIEVHYKIIMPCKAEYEMYGRMLMDEQELRSQLTNQRRQKIKQNREIKQQQQDKQRAIRKQRLTAALAKHGLKLRPDSQYSKNYIESESQSLTSTVNMAVIMNFLYSKTKYPIILQNLQNNYQKINDQLVEMYREEHYHYTRDDFESVSDSELDSLKLKAVKDYIIKNGTRDLPAIIYFEYEKYLPGWLRERSN